MPSPGRQSSGDLNTEKRPVTQTRTLQDPSTSYRIAGVENLSREALIRVLQALISAKTGQICREKLHVRFEDDSIAFVQGRALYILMDSGEDVKEIAVSRKVLQPIINRGVPVKDTTAEVRLEISKSEFPIRKRKFQEISASSLTLPLGMGEVLGKRNIGHKIFPIKHSYKSVKFSLKEEGSSQKTWARFFELNKLNRLELVHAVYLEISRDERVVVLVPHATPEISSGRVDLGKFPIDIHPMKLSALQRLLDLPLFVCPPWGVPATAVQRVLVDSAVLEKSEIYFELGNVGLSISGQAFKRLVREEGWNVQYQLWRQEDLVMVSK